MAADVSDMFERLSEQFLADPDAEGKVHPVAELFPMMSDGELDDLAADIKANGQRYPVMLDARGVLLDGRNRVEACRRIGVKADAEVLLPGIDPVAFIWSANITRRHMTKGQIAMSAARVLLVSGKTQQQAAALTKISQQRISQANKVLQFAPELAGEVMSGATPLDAAYEIATKRKQEASGTEAKLARLQDMAPDLAELVTEERMTLGEATAAAHQRAAERQQAIDAARRASENLVDFCSVAVTIAGGYELGARGLVTLEKLAELADAMTLLKRLFEEHER